MKRIKKIGAAFVALFCFFATACTGGISFCNQCVDANKDHQCDECRTKISACTDLDEDHICDVCKVSVSAHVDKNNDHVCDVCETIVSEHSNKNNDHICDVCGSVNFVDYEALTNKITTEYMSGLVTIYIQYRGWTTWENLSLSSGVVYDIDDEKGVYYLLTNNHSLFNYYGWQESGYTTRIVVCDWHENGYEGTVVCRDEAYDLAVIKIEKTQDVNLYEFPFAAEDPTVGQKVACIGHPEGQKNAVSYGSVVGYDDCNLQHEFSRVEFACINHNAWMLQGSSGGLLMSIDGEIVGINFAVSQNQTEEFVSGWAIPVRKIKEFLAANGSAFTA